MLHVVAAYAKGWLDRRFVRLAARTRVKSEEERQRRGRILEFIRTDKDALTIFVVEIAVEASLGAAMSVIAILLSGGVLGLDVLKTRPAGQPGARTDLIVYAVLMVTAALCALYFFKRMQARVSLLLEAKGNDVLEMLK